MSQIASKVANGSLRVRQPSGKVAWPTILVEGGEKAGKSVTALSLSASPHVGRTFVFDMGEGTADEYKALGPYEVVDHDGTFVDFIAQLRLATQEPRVADDKPNVIVVDSATVLWESIKDWADARARRGRSARQILERDPDADISIPMNIWTDAAERWGQMMGLLRYWPGVGVITCRAKEVAKVSRDGSPVAGQTDYKIEGHKTVGNAVSAIVRCEAPKRTRLMAAWKLGVDIPNGGLLLPEDGALDHVVFEVIGAGQAFDVSSAVAPQHGMTVKDAKRQLVEIVGSAEVAADVWKQAEAPSTGEVSDAMWQEIESIAATCKAPDNAQEVPA